jgi:hypothetical protein
LTAIPYEMAAPDNLHVAVARARCGSRQFRCKAWRERQAAAMTALRTAAFTTGIS